MMVAAISLADDGAGVTVRRCFTAMREMRA